MVAVLLHFLKTKLLKIATWIGAGFVLLQLIFSKRKRQEWQEMAARLDETNRRLAQGLARIDALRASRSQAHP